MKKVLGLLLVVFAAVSLTSCLGSKKEYLTMMIGLLNMVEHL